MAVPLKPWGLKLLGGKGHSNFVHVVYEVTIEYPDSYVQQEVGICFQERSVLEIRI